MKLLRSISSTLFIIGIRQVDINNLSQSVHDRGLHLLWLRSVVVLFPRWETDSICNTVAIEIKIHRSTGAAWRTTWKYISAPHPTIISASGLTYTNRFGLPRQVHKGIIPMSAICLVNRYVSEPDGLAVNNALLLIA